MSGKQKSFPLSLYLGHGLNKKLLVWYSGHGLNNITITVNLHNEQAKVCYSDVSVIHMFIIQIPTVF